MKIKDKVKESVKDGNWMVRMDDNGLSYRGFKWNPKGQWTTAPDWTEEARCGEGLHGQTKESSGLGYCGGSLTPRVVFCMTKGKHVDLQDKVKVKSAMILMENELPNGLVFNGNLCLRDTYMTRLPLKLTIGNTLSISFSDINSITKGVTFRSLLATSSPLKYLSGDRELESLSLEGTHLERIPDNILIKKAVNIANSDISRWGKGFNIRSGSNIYAHRSRIEALPNLRRKYNTVAISKTGVEKLPYGCTISNLHVSNPVKIPKSTSVRYCNDPRCIQ